MKTKKLSMADFAEVGVDELLAIKGGVAMSILVHGDIDRGGGAGGCCCGPEVYMDFSHLERSFQNSANDFTNSAVGQGLQRGWNVAVDIATDFYNMASGVFFNAVSPVKVLPGGVPKNIPNQDLIQVPRQTASIGGGRGGC